jgi:hypothetical protein
VGNSSRTDAPVLMWIFSLEEGRHPRDRITPPWARQGDRRQLETAGKGRLNLPTSRARWRPLGRQPGAISGAAASGAGRALRYAEGSAPAPDHGRVSFLLCAPGDISISRRQFRGHLPLRVAARIVSRTASMRANAASAAARSGAAIPARNGVSLLLCTQAALPPMLQRLWGRIVYISSGQGAVPARSARITTSQRPAWRG